LVSVVAESDVELAESEVAESDVDLSHKWASPRARLGKHCSSHNSGDSFDHCIAGCTGQCWSNFGGYC